MPVAAEHNSWAPVQLNLTVDESLLYPAVDESLLILTAPVARELSTMVLKQDMAHGKNEPLPRLMKA